MRRLFQNFRLLLAACLITACTPARTGVIGNTLTTNVKPEISITGQAPLLLQSSGRLRPNSGMTTTSDSVGFTFDYAFFTDNNAEERFAYAAIVRIDNAGWLFHPPARFDGAFALNDRNLGDFHWTVQLLRVAGDNDWASGVWEDASKGGVTTGTPKFWLAKRWVAHLDDTARAVMEYREPWPDVLRMLNETMPLLSDSAAAFLQQFEVRADSAFVVEKKRGEFDRNMPQPKTVQSRFPVSIATTVGTIMDKGGS